MSSKNAKRLTLETRIERIVEYYVRIILRIHRLLLKEYPCQASECKRPWIFRDFYCRKHHYYFKRYGDPCYGEKKKQFQTRSCMVAGCRLEHYAKGKCRSHYWGYQVPRKVRNCSIEGCKKSHRARGYCQMHWFRWWKGVDVVRGRLPGRQTKAA